MSRRLRVGRGGSTALLLLAVLIALPCRAAAEDDAAPPPAAWREIGVGGMASAHSWTLYSNSTFAPLGPINADGLRVRLGSGYGKFDYTVPAKFHFTCPKPSLICPATPVKGRVTFADIMAGYRFSYGPVTAKAFAGYAIDTQGLSPFDDGNAAGGKARGPRLALETWTNLSRRLWLQADGSWSAAHAQASVLTRLGYRVLPSVSLGVEEAYFQNVAGHEFRSGVFARYEWDSGEVVAAGGLKGERHSYTGDDGKDGPWGSLSVLFRY